MTTFRKDATSLDRQIETLLRRGLIIEQPERAKRYLENISYFRLSAYTRPFYIPGFLTEDDHQFLPGTTFEQILDLYIFEQLQP